MSLLGRRLSLQICPLLLRLENGQQSRIRTLIYSNKKGVNRALIAKLQQKIDISPTAIKKWMKRRQEKIIENDHNFIPQRHQVLGPDLATSHFIIARGGAAKFVDIDHWYKLTKDKKVPLPNLIDKSFRLEGIDASNMELFYHSFDNLVNLVHLRYLNLSGCQNIDDWCLDRLSQFKDTLEMLDISDCPHVSERGLASLHKLRKLRVLHVHNMTGVHNKPLVAVMLEEAMPGCSIEGMSFSNTSQLAMEDAEPSLPGFLQNFENFALGKKLNT